MIRVVFSILGILLLTFSFQVQAADFTNLFVDIEQCKEVSIDDEGNVKATLTYLVGTSFKIRLSERVPAPKTIESNEGVLEISVGKEGSEYSNINLRFNKKDGSRSAAQFNFNAKDDSDTYLQVGICEGPKDAGNIRWTLEEVSFSDD